MHGSFRILFFVTTLLPLSLHAISEMEIIKLIDQKKYSNVLDHFPAKPSGAEAHLVLKAHAQLGLAGFEPLELIQKVRAQQGFSHPLIGEYFEKCPNVQLAKKLTGAVKCIVLRLFNQMPRHDNEMLLAARETFALISEKGALGRQDRFLYALVELSIVLSKLREVLFMYDKLDANNVSYAEASAIFLMIRSAGEDFESFVKQYKNKDLEIIFNHQFFGSKEGALFKKTAEGKVEFLEESGLPMFFRVTDMDKESTTELAGRNIIIQIIDRADNHFRTE